MFKIKTPDIIRIIPPIPVIEIFSLKINTEISVVATIPTPDHTAYAILNVIFSSDLAKK